MHYTILHSLQHMAAVKIAIGIFYDSEIEKMLEEDKKYPWAVLCSKFNRDRRELWKLIQMKAVEKMPCLSAFLQTRVCNYIQALLMDSREWIKDHGFLRELDPSHGCLAYKSMFCWKSDGTINRVETAKKIVQNKNIDAIIRFILACNYFLEDEVLAIWHGNEEVNKKSVKRKGTNSAVRFWMNWLRKGSVTPWRLMVDDYFSIPCFKRSDIPVRFSSFFSYLSHESRATYFDHFALDPCFPSFDKDEFFSCMCEMEEAERTKLVQLIPQDAVLYCLSWPFQTLFVEMVNHLESYEKDYCIQLVFVKIVSSIVHELHDFDYVELLRGLWNTSGSFKEEIEKYDKYSQMVEAILNYDEDSQSLSLAEIVDKCIHG